LLGNQIFDVKKLCREAGVRCDLFTLLLYY